MTTPEPNLSRHRQSISRRFAIGGSTFRAKAVFITESSAGVPGLVAQSCPLLYRRIAFCRPLAVPDAPDSFARFADYKSAITAERNSALRIRMAEPKMMNGIHLVSLKRWPTEIEPVTGRKSTKTQNQGAAAVKAGTEPPHPKEMQ